MRIDVMREDERFVGMNGNKIILENEKGEVRIVMLVEDEFGVHVDKTREVIIGFGEGMVTAGDMDEDIEVTIF